MAGAAVSELRWVLVLIGLVVLGLVFFFTRYQPLPARPALLNRWQRKTRVAKPAQPAAAPAPAPAPPPPRQPERIVTVRLMARTPQGFAGEELVLALREAGLRHGRFGIFHRLAAEDDSAEVFSVASLVEPGRFDLSGLKTARYPGVSLFLILPAQVDSVGAFDDMLATARALAVRLDGDLLDEQGSRLSVQRERYMREEIIQLQHRMLPA
jgi:cell division protein ZipA